MNTRRTRTGPLLRDGLASGGRRRRTGSRPRLRRRQRRRLEAAELVVLGESGDGGMVVEEEIHLVVPEVGGGAEGADGAGRAQGGVGAAVPVVLGVRPGRRVGLGRGAGGGSPGWLHAGLDPGLPAVSCVFC